MACIDLSLILESPENQKEDMGDLSKKDKEWFSKEIQTRVETAINLEIDKFQPHGWRRVRYFIKEWGLASALIATPIALLGLAGAGWWNAFSRVEKQATFEANTTAALNKISDRLDRLESGNLAAQIQQAAANPADENSTATAKRAIDSAIKNSIKVSPETVQQAGKKLVLASSQNAAAWDASLGLLRYKSFLNSTSLLIPTNTGASFITKYNSPPIPEGEHWPRMSVAGVVAEPLAARFDLIGRDQNKNGPMGSKYIFEDGGAIVIDGMELRNVIFRGVKIIYSGGPVEMTNVYFIDCTFEMKHTQKSQDFALAVLTPPPSTTFSGM